MDSDILDKDVIYVIGMIHDLKKSGEISSNFKFSLNITTRGLAVFDQIKASGFIPSPEKIKHILNRLTDPNFKLELDEYDDSFDN